VQQLSCLILFGLELILPFLIFAPRRLRQIPCVSFLALQLLILLTGNYCFFNLLSIVLCLVLLDDSALVRLFPQKCRWLIQLPVRPQPIEDPPGKEPETVSSPPAPPRRLLRWPIQVTFPLTCIALVIPAMQLGALLRVRVPWPSPVVALYRWVSPFRSFNNYGLFAVMTTNRSEIVVQGSTDGVNWVDYEFKYKPGDLKRRPRFVAPHQPRLDWQMWFAALGDYQHNFWFVEFCFRVLSGSPEVVGLLQRNPFPRAPPRYVRAVLYEYHFTDFATRRRTGAWWRREPKGQYLPVLSLQHEPK
jgi:hypothetical protein